MSESFRERAYTREELTGWLHEAGLEVLDVFEEMTMREVREETQRAVYIRGKMPVGFLPPFFRGKEETMEDAFEG